jgi:hypothetical protein
MQQMEREQMEIAPSLANELDGLQACVNGVLERIHGKDAGSRILFAGTNGAGKSWILNLLCFLTCTPSGSYKYKYYDQIERQGWKPAQEAHAYIVEFLAHDERNGCEPPPSTSSRPGRSGSHDDSQTRTAPLAVVEEILPQQYRFEAAKEFADEIGNLCELGEIDPNVKPFLLPSKSRGVSTTPCCVTIRGGPFCCVLFYKDAHKIKEEAFEWVMKNRDAVEGKLLRNKLRSPKLRIFKERWEHAVVNEWRNWQVEDFTKIQSHEQIKLRAEVESVAGKVFVFAGNGEILENDRKYVRDMLERSLMADTVAFLKHCVAFAPSTMLEGGACVTDSPGMDDADPFKLKALHDGFASHETVIVVLNKSLKESQHVLDFLTNKKEFFQNMLPEKKQKNVLAFLHYQEKDKANNRQRDQLLSHERRDHDELTANHTLMERQTKEEIDLLMRQAMPSLGEDARQQICRDRLVVLTVYPTLYASLSFNMGHHRSINDDFAASNDADIKKWTVQDVERCTKGHELIGLIACVNQRLLRLALKDLQAKLTDGRLSTFAAPQHEANKELIAAATRCTSVIKNKENKQLLVEAYAKQRDALFGEYYEVMHHSVGAFIDNERQFVLERSASTERSLTEGEEGWPMVDVDDINDAPDIGLVFHQDLGGQHGDLFFRPMLFRGLRNEPLHFEHFVEDLRAKSAELRSKLEQLVTTTLTKLVDAPASSAGSAALQLKGTVDCFVEEHVKPKMKRLDGFLTLGKRDSHIVVENLIGTVMNEVENRATRSALDELKEMLSAQGSSPGDLRAEDYQAWVDKCVSFIIGRLFGRGDEPKPVIYLEEWEATLEELVEVQASKLKNIVQAKNWPLATAFMTPFSKFLIARSDKNEQKGALKAFHKQKARIEAMLKRHFLENRQYQDIVAYHCGSSVSSLEGEMREEGERCVRELYDIGVQRLMTQKYRHTLPRDKCDPQGMIALTDVKKVYHSTRTDCLDTESVLEYSFADRIKLRPSARLPDDLRLRLKDSRMDPSCLFYALGHQVFGDLHVNSDGFVQQLRYQTTAPPTARVGTPWMLSSVFLFVGLLRASISRKSLARHPEQQVEGSETSSITKSSSSAATVNLSRVLLHFTRIRFTRTSFGRTSSASLPFASSTTAMCSCTSRERQSHPSLLTSRGSGARVSLMQPRYLAMKSR